MAFLLLAVGPAIAGFGVGRYTATVNGTDVQTEQDVAIVSRNEEVPLHDVPGADIRDLPRFPGSTRVEYRQESVDGSLETEVEYLVSGRLDTVHDYYRVVFAEEGWSVADLGVRQGEWTFLLIKDDREALLELEARGTIVEVEIEVMQPVTPDGP